MRTSNPTVQDYKTEMERLLRAGRDSEAGEIGIKIHGLLAEEDLPEFHRWLGLLWKRIKNDRKETQVAQLKAVLETAAPE